MLLDKIKEFKYCPVCMDKLNVYLIVRDKNTQSYLIEDTDYPLICIKTYSFEPGYVFIDNKDIINCSFVKKWYELNLHSLCSKYNHIYNINFCTLKPFDYLHKDIKLVPNIIEKINIDEFEIKNYHTEKLTSVKKKMSESNYNDLLSLPLRRFNYSNISALKEKILSLSSLI